MLTTTAIASLAPVGRRVASTAVQRFMAGGVSGLGSVGRSTGLGVLPAVLAVGQAAGSAAGSYFAADAAKAQADAQVDMAEMQYDALIAPSRYQFKALKAQSKVDRFALTVDAASGKTVNLTKDYSGLVIAGGIGLAVIAAGFLLMKGV